jgi:PBP1b-binding outer membrane lipoprotein LpoB
MKRTTPIIILIITILIAGCSNQLETIPVVSEDLPAETSADSANESVPKEKMPLILHRQLGTS